MNENTRNSLLLPAFSGILLTLSFPPIPLGFIAWFALIPLFISLNNCSLKDAFRRGLVFGLVFNAASMHFVSLNSGTTFLTAFSSYLATVLILMFFGPLFTLPATLILRKGGKFGLLLLPVIWTAVEYLRSQGEIASPWNIVPLSQANYLPVIQMVSIFGIWGISFWAAGINVLAIKAYAQPKKWLAVVIVWIVIPFAGGWIVLSQAQQPEKTIGILIVQGNIDPAEKWSAGLDENLDSYQELTLSETGADLAVWPEAAVPTNLNLSLFAKNYLRELAREADVPILTGALAREYSDDKILKRYNCAYLIDPASRAIERYDKVHLVPGGERIPFQKLIPVLGKMNFGQAEFTPGDEFKVLEVDSAGFGTMICFESIFPYMGRRYARQGVDFLVNITNDGWYGKSSEPYQHALLTRFRAVENRRSLVRAANTGISYLTDGYGRYIAKSELETREVVRGSIPIHSGETFYSRHGDVFAKIMLAVTVCLILFSLFGKSKFTILPVVFVMFFIGVNPTEAENRYLTLSSSYSKSLSLGGPAAMEGGILSVPVNPAGFSLYRNSYKPRISVFLNPVGSFIAFQGMQEGEWADDKISYDDAVIPALLLVKGVGVSYRALNAGLLFGQQYPAGTDFKRFFEYYPIFDGYYNRVFMKLELDEKVHIGISADMFTTDMELEGWGYSYGVLLKPGKLNAGVFYCKVPDEHQDDVLPGHRLVSETINAGVSWQPFEMMKLYGGLRNISEKNSEAFLEPHGGIEAVPWKHTAIRAGYYLEDGSDNAFSFGLGICDLNDFRALDDVTPVREYLLDYSMSLLPGELFIYSLSIHFRL